MKKNKLLVFLGATISLLSLNITHALQKDRFAATVTKPIPGQPKHVMLFKTAAEIPEFKKSTEKDKSKWNSLIKQVNNQTMAGIKEEKLIKQLPIIQKFEKLSNTLFAKKENLNKALDKILENNPQIRKLTSEEQALKKKLEPLQKQKKVLENKIRDLQLKRGELFNNIEKIKTEAQKSKDFPKDLQKLATEIEQLKTEFSELYKKAFDAREKHTKKVDFGKLMEIGIELRKLFENMTK